MSDSRVSRERALFERALAMPTLERGDFIGKSCEDDAALRQRLDALLRAAKAAGDFLAVPPEAADDDAPGARIGPYRLVERLGEGGFGVVYRAEQAWPVQREVALKIVKVGMDTRAVVARFGAEQQALARMEHPHIARVFDAGETGRGRPYFAMELVRGTPLTVFGRERRPTVRERLEIFIQICRAVQHAHQKGVIHRDLKPSNILVAAEDGRPVAKVIDFGVAKAIREPLTDQSLHTHHHLFIGTPPYMSPEQFGCGGRDVDTRADIYSLGALLYEWLVDATPFDGERLAQRGYAEVERTLREVEPPAPSQRLAALSCEAQGEAAQARRTTRRRLLAALRGDLDRIVLKCLEKDRDRRYDTAAALARDVERYLRHEPVSAQPASVAYQAAKFMRRHARGAIVAAAALAVLAGLGAYHTRRLTVERDRARAEAEKTRKVSDLLTDALSVHDPFRSPGAAGTADNDVLAACVARARKDFVDQPELRAEILNAVGRMHLRLGRYDEAQSLLVEALDASRAAGLVNDNVAQSLNDLGVLRRERGDYGGAVNALREALALRRQLPRNDANALAVTLVELGRTYSAQERFGPAEDCLREALDLRREALGEHRETAVSLGDLGVLLWLEGDLAGAEPLLEESLIMTRRTLGARHPNFAGALVNLALLRREQNNLPAAALLLRRALAIDEQTLGAPHWRTARVRCHLASVLRRENHLDAAMALLDQAISAKPVDGGERDPTAILIAQERGRVLLAKGEVREAAALLREALRGQEQIYPAQGWQVASTRSLLGEALGRLGRTDEAETLLLAAQGVLKDLPGVQGAETAATRARLVALYEQTGRAEKAQIYRRDGRKSTGT